MIPTISTPDNTTNHPIRNWLIGLLGLSLVIIAHEMGHFMACKLFNVATPVFSIGFGPTLFSFSTRTTVFQLAALPLGGYVSIDPLDFALQPYIKQIIIMLAGIIFNFLFALIVFAYLKYTPLEKESLSEKTKNHLDIARLQAKQLFAHRKSSGFIGPIGIISIAGSAVTYGTDLFFFILAVLSINIGIFNLLPIPGLDGSQIVSLTIEKLFGADTLLNTHYHEWLQLILVIIIALFIGYITLKDILHLRAQ